MGPGHVKLHLVTHTQPKLKRSVCVSNITQHKSRNNFKPKIDKYDVPPFIWIPYLFFLFLFLLLWQWLREQWQFCTASCNSGTSIICLSQKVTLLGSEVCQDQTKDIPMSWMFYLCIITSMRTIACDRRTSAHYKGRTLAPWTAEPGRVKSILKTGKNKTPTHLNFKQCNVRYSW